jgi:hypothetical protein
LHGTFTGYLASPQLLDIAIYILLLHTGFLALCVLILRLNFASLI